MSNISYKPLIEKMTWSYSRLETFEKCPNKFFSRYILKNPEEELFYASFGSFVHKLLADYYTKGLNNVELLTMFLTQFASEVHGVRPKGSIVENYIEQVSDYFRSLEPLPFNIKEVEKKLDFKIGDKKFVGIIDVIGEQDGNLYIVDHKSRALKQRSKRSKPTQNDKDIDKMLRQLYLYSAAIKDNYGVFPKQLCFNCFRSKEFIREDFNESIYNDTIEWAVSLIEEIENTDDFIANYEYFWCWNICGCHDRCDEFIYQVED